MAKSRQAEKEAEEKIAGLEKRQKDSSDSIKAILDSKQKEAETEKKKAAAAETCSSQLKDQLRSKDHLIDSLRKELEEDNRSLREERQAAKQNELLVGSLQQQIEQLKKTITERDSDVRGLKSTLDKIKDHDLLANDEKVAALMAEISVLKALCTEKDKVISELKQELDALNKLLSARDSKLAVLQSELKDSKDAENSLREQLKREGSMLDGACREKDATIRLLQQDLDALKGLAAKRNDELKNLEELLDAATKKSGDVSESLRECQERDLEKDAVILALQESEKQKDDMIHTLIAASKVKENLINKLQKELDELRNTTKREIVPKIPVEIETPKERSQPEMPSRIVRQVPDLVGVGIRLTDIPPHKVVEIVADGPADNTGIIQVGDLLLSVNREDVSAMHISNIRKLIVGPQGSSVSMEFQRAGTNQIFTVTMQRQLHIEQY